jgi:hypothetical protein
MHARWPSSSASPRTMSRRRGSPRCSAATRCFLGCSRTQPATAAISSGTGPASSATGAPSPSARRSTRRASAGSFSSRVRDRRRTRGPPMAAPCCGRRFGNFCAARRCITLASRRLEPCASSRPGSRCCATCSTMAIRSTSRAPSCVAWPRRSSASATSRSSPRGVTMRCSSSWSISPSRVTSGISTARRQRGARSGSRRCASAPRA